jgi:hypothetical protein
MLIVQQAGDIDMPAQHPPRATLEVVQDNASTP